MLVSVWDGSVVGWLVKVPAICWCLSWTDLLLAGWLGSQKYVGVSLGRICCWLVG